MYHLPYQGRAFIIDDSGAFDLDNQNLSTADLTAILDSLTPEQKLAIRQMSVSENLLTSVPDSIGELTNLTWLNLSYNNIEVLPDSICNLEALRLLDLSFNELTFLPCHFGQLRNLREVNLSMNSLQVLPYSAGFLQDIATLNLSNNPWLALPENLRLYRTEPVREEWPSVNPLRTLCTQATHSFRRADPAYVAPGAIPVDLVQFLDGPRGICQFGDHPAYPCGTFAQPGKDFVRYAVMRVRTTDVFRTLQRGKVPGYIPVQFPCCLPHYGRLAQIG